MACYVFCESPTILQHSDAEPVPSTAIFVLQVLSDDNVVVLY